MDKTDWIKATNQINFQIAPTSYYSVICVICGCATPVAQIDEKTFICGTCKSAVKWAKEKMMAEKKER